LGAFIGDTPYCFVKTFKVDKVYAFEPDPDNFRILKENLRLNKLENAVIPIELGVGKEKGSFYLTKAGAGSAVVERKSKDAVKVKVTTIDEFVEENKIKKVDFIKMDIEGAEFDALKGAVKTIKRDKPDLLIAIYHKGEHFFEIPGWLKKLVPQYNLRFIAMNGASPVIERYIGASIIRNS
jgi:FkbM family methyltransferase